MKKITKSFLLSTCFLFELATFTHATKLSKLLEDEDLFRICELGEKILLNYYEYDLTIIQHCNISNYCKSFLHHNDREFLECCEILYHTKLIKDYQLLEEEEILILNAFQIALRRIAISKESYAILYLIKNGKFSQDDIDFFINFDFLYYIKKIEQYLSYNNLNFSSQQAPKKSSCTIL